MAAGWRSVTSFVHEFRSSVAKAPLGVDEPRAAAAMLATRIHGLPLVAAQPVLTNLAALALSHRERLVVHELRGAVPRVAAETDLHTLPTEPPRLLQTPWILEVRAPGEEVLFGRTASLAGYELDGVIYLIGLDHPDGVWVAPWRPAWTGGELEEGTVQDASPLVDNVEAHQEWAREAARFAVVLGLLLDATGSPLRMREEGPSLPGRRHGKPRPATPWVTRRVYLDGAGGGGWAGAEARVGGDGASVAGRVEARVEVRGHLKLQPYGPGGRERRLIYVASHEARRWVAPRPLRVVVSA